MYRKTVILSIIIVAALALSACGEQVQELESVKIAVLAPDATWGVCETSFALALEEYNERGVGAPVELVYISTDTPDDPTGWFSPEAEAAAVQQALDDPEVVLIYGGFSDTMTRGGLQVANEGGIAYLGAGALWAGFSQPGYAPGEPGIFFPTGERNFFRGSPRDDQIARLMTRFISEEIGDVGSIYLANWPLSANYAGQLQLAAMDAGWEVVGMEEYESVFWAEWDGDPATEYAIADETWAMAQRIVDAEPGVLFVDEEPTLIYAVRELDPDLPIVGWIFPYTSEIAVEGHDISELNGVYQQDPYPHPALFDTETGAAFLANYEAENGPIAAGFEGQWATFYETMRFALRAIEEADPLTRAGVIDSMYALQYSGVWGDWHYTPEGDMSFAACSFLEWQDDEWVTVDFVVRETE